MISIKFLAPSLEPASEELTSPIRAHTNFSLTALSPGLLILNAISFIVIGRENRVTSILKSSAPKPPPPRIIHGIKWGIAGKVAVLY